ncbi:MAG: TIGR02453 family protein, partial [Nocardioides sp.]|nr:TIGR02453 family protein [Nocardioides sp.]
KSIHLGRTIGFEPIIHTPDLVDEVKKDWRAVRPLIEWIAEHAVA